MTNAITRPEHAQVLLSSFFLVFFHTERHILTHTMASITDQTNKVVIGLGLIETQTATLVRNTV